jgi:alanyl-tRNA synthetase
MHKRIICIPVFPFRFGLAADRLWISVFEDDNEAFEIWHDEVS